MKSIPVRRGPVALVLAAALGAAGCGGGGGEKAQGYVSGRVWASGPVAGATIRAVQWDIRGEPIATSAETKTGDDGSFRLDVGPAYGTLVFEVSGPGSYEEAYSGASIALDQRVVLRGYVTGFAPNEDRAGVTVSPLTHLVVAQAESRFAKGDFETIRDALERVADRIGNHFCGIGLPEKVVPADLGQAGSTTSDVRYSLCLAALSYLSDQIAQAAELTADAANTLSVTELLAADLASAETHFDGQGPDGPLVLGECKAGETVCTFTANTPRARLGTGVFAFLGSERNGTGLAPGAVAVMVEALRTNDDPELFGDMPPDPEAVDRDAPEIVWESPTPEDNAVVDGAFLIRARASDELTAKPRLRIVAPSWLSDEDGDLTNEVVTAQVDPQSAPDDTVTVVLEAEDDAGNVGTAMRRFLIDRGPPVIVIDSPLDGSVYGGSVTLDATAGDDHLVFFEITSPAELAGMDQDSALEHILYTVAPGTYPDGPLTFTLTARDMTDQVNEKSVTVTLDTTSPQVLISAVPEGTWTRFDVPVSVTVDDANPDPAELAVTHNGAATGASFTASTSEPHTVTATATDLAGNSASASRSFTVDKVAPVITVTGGPAPGSYVRGAVSFVAVLDDNLKALGSLPLMDATFSAAVSGVGSPSVTQTLTALPDQRLRREVSISTAPADDGPLTVSFSGADRAGNMATGSASIDVTVDNTAPVVVAAELSPADNFLAGAAGGTMTVSGRATDATSGVTAVEVEVTDAFGGVTLVPATLFGSATNRTFTATVTLNAKACTDPIWSGSHAIRVRARDAAGNWSSVVQRQGIYDNCAPKVTVEPTVIRNERVYGAGFVAGSYRPCLFYDAGLPMGTTTTLAYDVNAATEPAASSQVFKYAVNAGPGGYGCPASPTWAQAPPGGYAADSDGNPIRWHLHASDVGPGVSALRYRIKPPGGTFGPEADVPAVGGIPNVTHELVVTTANAPGLDTTEGVWEIQLRVTDQAGNETIPWTVKWDHKVLAGPVHVQVLGGDMPPENCAGAVPFVVPSSHTLAANNMNALFGTAGSCIVIKKLRIRNGTNRSAEVKVDAQAQARWSRTLRTANPANGELKGSGSPMPPLCSPNAFSPPTTSGTCLGFTPATGDASSPLTDLPGFLTGQRAYDVTFAMSSTPATACSGTDTGCWAIPAAPDPAQPRQLDVYLLSSKWTFLWDGDGTPADFTLSTASGTWYLFGRQVREWGKGRFCDNPHTPVTEWCIDKFKEAKFLETAKVEIQSANVANRATFTLRAPGASGFHALTALPTMGLTFSYLAGTESAP